MSKQPDGTLVPFMAFPTPLRDASGTLIGAVNMLVELSEQQRTKRIERRLAAIVESSDDAIISKDAQWHDHDVEQGGGANVWLFGGGSDWQADYDLDST